MHTVDLVHEAALLLVALTFLRGVQALAEHFTGDNAATGAARYILGGP